nr:actin protein 10 [Hymenolepis microstoma]
MAIYDSMIGEKPAIVFDLGTAYLKIGFAGEANPRYILPSPFATMDFAHVNLFESLKELFHRLCYKYLIVNAKERRVVIVESIMMPTNFRQSVADVLFLHFEVLSVLFAPSHLVALFTLGVSTGLVLDCGFTEALILPIYEGYTILNAWHSAPLGSKHIQKELGRQILELGFVNADEAGTERFKLTEVPDFDPDRDITPSALEDIIGRACFVSPMERAAAWKRWAEAPDTTEPPNYASEVFTCPLGGGKGRGPLLVHIPSRLRESVVEVLFTPQDDLDGVSITSMFLDCLLMCPIDCRMAFVQNIVCIGGTTMLPGFIERLNEELKRSLDLPKYSSLKALKEHIKFHQPPSKPNYTAWLGGAIFGALECLPGRSILRESYLANPKLPDWNELPEETTAVSAPQSELEPKHSR